MANTIASAYVQIIPSADGIQGQLSGILDGEATKAGASAGSKLSGALGGAVKAGVGAVAALGTAAVGAGVALTNAASGVAQYGDNIDKMSQKLGVSASFYQEWDAVLNHSGTSMDAMGATFKKLATSVQNGSKDQIAAYQQLGLSMADLQGMSTEDVFTSVITALQGMEEGTERTALATQLLGKGATELGPLLNTSAEDTQSMIDAVNDLGGVMSDDAVKNAAAFQDQLQDLQTAFSGVKNGIMGELLPSFTSIMGGLTGLITGSNDAGAQLSAGVSGLVSQITTALPGVISAISTIAQSILPLAPELIRTLADGILSSLPELLPVITDVILNIAEMLISMAPQLLTTGLEILVQLALGIAQALPTLIPTITDVILQIVETLIDNIDLLVDCALQLMMALAVGIVNAIPILIEKTPVIISKLVEALKRNFPKILEAGKEILLKLKDGIMLIVDRLKEAGQAMIDKIKETIKSKISEFLEIGKNIVTGLWDGINDKVQWLKDKISGFVGDVTSWLKKFFKIGSPSKVMADEVGKWIPLGIAQGIDDNLNAVTNAVDDVANAALIDGSSLYGTNALNMSHTYSGETATDASLYGLLATYLPQIANGGNVTIKLEGGAERMFTAMREQNYKFKKLTGSSAFA